MRTRFAPSPTGLLHIGSLRTALYAYIVARQTGGTFILRIEDTDREREVEGAVEKIVDALHWAGLDPDEGVLRQGDAIVQEGSHGPYVQSERFEIYSEHAQKLLDDGNAYYAFDTPEELERMREEEKRAGNPAPKYDASVRMRMQNSLTLGEEETKKRIDAGDPYVVRMRIPEGNVVRFSDDVRGTVEFRGIEIDDQVLLKSDGFPTYHLANVVDDHLMDINFVIRGEEWLSSTPKHLLLFEYFGWEAPRYAHVPLLLNQDKSKLSKRQNDVSVDDYIEQGFLPEALINFVAFLGWNPGTTEEMFSLDALIEAFSLERIQKGGAVFDRNRLEWYQGQWIRSMSPEEFSERIKPIVAAAHPEAEKDTNFTQRAALIHERITFFHEAPEMLQYYYREPDVTTELLANKKQKLKEEDLPQILDDLLSALQDVSDGDWNEEGLKAALDPVLQEKGYKPGQLLWPLRAALTGLPFSPGAYEVAAALGKETTLKRLENVKKQ